ncbi:MAG TPA: macro domain-containing protein [Planctomycetota bacterium]|nr:macro domain-containing protein [Planctomycetota bacterium]
MREVVLERALLEEIPADVIGYGAKDTGEMGGGAAASVLREAGPQLLPALQWELKASTRQVGEVVLTDAFSLQGRGIRWIAHIISIIKNTPEGAWCPRPERLYDGVLKALKLSAGKGARTVAFSMLGTGEGRVKPSDAAGHMIRAVRDFHRRGGELSVTFALPTFRDYEAARALLSGGRQG